LSIALFIVLAVVLLLAYYSLKKTTKKRAISEGGYKKIESAKLRYRDAYEIEQTYGPLSFAEAEELAWPLKQFISIKKPDDKYSRWAKVEEIRDDNIRYIGSATDCWLSIDGPYASELRPYHLGMVRSRGSFFVFELDANCKPSDLNYDWWNHPYSHLTDSDEFEVGGLRIVFYRKKKPITIEGKNTDGVAVLNMERETSAAVRTGTIGSASDCWITLPDSELPQYMAVRRTLGHHRVLYAYGASADADYLTRADRECELGGYRITFS